MPGGRTSEQAKRINGMQSNEKLSSAIKIMDNVHISEKEYAIQ